MRHFLLATAICIAACSPAPDAPAPVAPVSTEITDSSFSGTDGSRSIQLSVSLPAPPVEVYRTIATVEGWKTWAAPAVFGEIKLNGEFETSYSADATAGDPANIRQLVLALVPDSLVVFRTVQTPPGFPHPDLFKQTVTTMQLAPEASGTRLTLTHSGFGTSPEWDELHGFFEQGDRQTLEVLQKVFVK
jgi:uncharacterized protein YndB with AHSA1/START domain